MTEFQKILLELNENLSILREREAKQGEDAPLKLLNQIRDHGEAIELTEQVIANQLSEDDWRDDRLLVASLQDGLAEIYPLPIGESVFLKGHTDDINEVAFSPDRRYLAIASDDQTARIWDAVTGEAVVSLTGHQHSVNGVAFSPDGKLILTYSSDNTARLWDFPPVTELIEQTNQRFRPSWQA